MYLREPGKEWKWRIKINLPWKIIPTLINLIRGKRDKRGDKNVVQENNESNMERN